jgi:hypothetical protein
MPNKTVLSYSLQDAAGRAGMSVSRLRALVEDGKGTGESGLHSIIYKNKICFPWEAFNQWLAARGPKQH